MLTLQTKNISKRLDYKMHHKLRKNISHNMLLTSFISIYVVVQFGFWFNLDFPLFFSMLIYDNEYQTKENPNWTKNQIELQHIQDSYNCFQSVIWWVNEATLALNTMSSFQKELSLPCFSFKLHF